MLAALHEAHSPPAPQDSPHDSSWQPPQGHMPQWWHHIRLKQPQPLLLARAQIANNVNTKRFI